MRSIVRNLIVRILSLFPVAIATLIATRLLLEQYDVDVFNAYTLIFSLMILIPLNDLGAGAALTTAVAEDGAQHEHTRRVALTAARALSLSGLALAIAAFTLSAFGWWNDVLGEGSYATWTFGIVLAAYGASFVPGLGQSALLGANKNELTILVQASLPPAMAAGAGVCVVLDAPASAVVVVPGVAMLVIALVNAWVGGHETGLHLLPLLRKIPNPRRYPGAKISGIAGPALIVLLLGPITLQSDRLVLSHFSTAKDVAAYSVGLQVFSPVFALIPAAARPLWPIFARARVTGTKAISLTKVIALFAVGTLAISGVLVVLSGPIARFVSDGEVDIGIALPILLAAGTMIQAITVPMAMALMYPAGLRVVARLSLLATPINLIGSILVAPSMGAPGPLYVGVAVTVLLQMIPAMVYVHRNGLGPPREPIELTEIADLAMVDLTRSADDGATPAPDTTTTSAPRVRLSKHEIGIDFGERWRETDEGRSW